jgi:hypothetical protein
MSNGLRARIVDIHRIEIAGIAGCAQPLVLGLKQNHAQNVINNVGRGGHNANVLSGAVTDAPRNSLPTGHAEQWSYRAMLRHDETSRSGSAPARQSVSKEIAGWRSRFPGGYQL